MTLLHDGAGPDIRGERSDAYRRAARRGHARDAPGDVGGGKARQMLLATSYYTNDLKK
jgi:hypothetical protein